MSGLSVNNHFVSLLLPFKNGGVLLMELSHFFVQLSLCLLCFVVAAFGFYVLRKR